MLLASCFEGNREPTEADRSAFGTFVDSLDTSVEGKWFTRMGLSDDADSLLSYLRRELSCHGLDTLGFHVPEMAEDLAVVRQLAFDSVGRSINSVLPHLDSLFSDAYVTYTTGQRYGFVRPNKAFNFLDTKQKGGFARLFDEEVEEPNAQEAYRYLTSDERMAYLLSSQPHNHLYQSLQRELANAKTKDIRHKIAVNMERCRWQMKQPEPGQRMVLVNIPSQQLWAVGGDSVLDMKICCGAVATKTPLLQSAISYMQVNPEWIIPQNIIDNDVACHGGDSAYFVRNRYYITHRATGDTLQPTEVTSDDLMSGRLRVGQKGGAGNSLGRIVFRFANNFSVYLHDTNNRGAFNRDQRTLSHGCVRVQKPFELACFLVPDMDEWESDKLRISMDMVPLTPRGVAYVCEHADDSRPFRLVGYHDVSPKVPLYIIYYTVYPNPKTGIMEFWPDWYGYDKVITKEMGSLIL